VVSAGEEEVLFIGTQFSNLSTAACGMKRPADQGVQGRSRMPGPKQNRKKNKKQKFACF
jgi:hypothetical protein